MRITGYRCLVTVHEWGRPVGDVNGVIAGGITEVPVVLLETDEGLTGVGLGGHADVHRVFPALEGQDPRAVTSLYDRMLSHVFKSGHGGSTFGTIGALDMALWDLKAKLAGEPLWRTLGAADRFVPGYASGLEYALTDEELVAFYEGWARRGFTGAKVKGGLDLDRDVRRLAAVRDVLRANTSRPALMYDVNESWGRHQAVRSARRVEEDVDLTWIEEPVRRWDVAGHRAVTTGARAAVASGENLTGLEHFRPLLDAGAVDVVQTGSVWGITHFLRVATVAFGHNLPVSPVGYNANPVAHAAAAVPNHLATEIQDLAWPVGLRVDQEIADGGIVLGDAPGLGIEVDEDRIAAHTASGRWSVVAGPHVRPADAGLRLAPQA
ncbi:mandelate racemase/muconate lactonizing enzyme family protein [Prauserella cavernicola]|uniref:Mandelate racemase/muconate lactonizing enzyme family protein n=1 Tax=Prauserella cavernicola TaxID=2800127 RepID=A0A934QQG8_9PSEU|nr:mandelate racemase/muconate lactonizing enzyme family protein [Prauserella cavernicola]MBK1783844.1 mandelate racemase/muconate lactonizing enzyme family protein [Prauserella cavernicola]